MEKEKLERETRELQSQLQKAECAAALAKDKEETEKAARFSRQMQTGAFMKQPKAVTLVQTKKKRKSLKTETIKNADEEDEEDPIPEGFHLEAKSPHYLNREHSEDYQAYLHQIVLEYERLLKAGGKDMLESYGEIIKHFYWVCKVNKNNIIYGVEGDQILQSVKDPTCKAWKMKLQGKKTVDLTSIINKPVIGPQKASDIVSVKPEDLWELVEEEIGTKTPQQIKMIKTMINNLCASKALVHRHAADSAYHLSPLCNLVSLPITLKVMNATL